MIAGLMRRTKGGKADPTLLPAATGQLPGAGTYARGQASGFTYTDPVSGVLVCKVTSDTVPTAGRHNHPYATGGPFISQPWQSGGVTYYTCVVAAGGYAVDVRHSDLALSNFRVLTFRGENGIAFSMDPATPRICYVADWDNNRINRYNTATDAIDNIGHWPWNIAAAGSFPLWLQVNKNDVWVVGMMNSNATMIAFKPATGVEIDLTVAEGLATQNEPHLDLVDNIAYITTSEVPGNNPWLLDTDTLDTPPADPMTNGGSMTDDHATPIRGGMAGWCADGTPYGGAYYYKRADDEAVRFIQGDDGFHGGNADWYNCGYGNAFGFGTNFLDQWFFADRFISDDAAEKVRKGVIAVVKLDGDVRFFAAHDSITSEYDDYPQTCCSPDGKLVMWTTDENNTSLSQVYVGKMPVS
jgi:hypothetical protein